MKNQSTWQLEELVGRALAGDVPGLLNERLHQQLADFRAGLPIAEPAGHAAQVWTRPARWGLACSLAVGILLAIMLGLSLRPQSSFAEVAAAALERPWVHVRELRDGKAWGEAWYSPSLAISASRSAREIEYRDYRLEVYYSYNTEEQILYRGPDVQKTRVPYSPISVAIMALLKPQRKVAEPLQALEFLGPEREKMKLLDQKMEQVTQDGHPWLDYHLTVSYSGSTEPMRMFFRADAVTKLPALCRLEGSPSGKPMVGEIEFDYPQNGPVDIFDLGVPKTAKFVDRLPTGDLKHILETLKVGRERMDDYRAVFVNLSDSEEDGWWARQPMVQYRHGDRFRADYTAGWRGNEAEQYKSPGEIDDRGRFWRERIKSFRFYPHYVLRDSTQYTAKTDLITDADGSQHVEIVSVQRYATNMKPGEDYPPEYSMRPEFACRPPLGIGDQHQQAELDLHPSEGPAGCILLAVRHTTDEGRINEQGVGLADENRFWLDPQRDYIVMRWDMLARDEAGNQQLHESDTVEEVARSPRGVWYATKIRRHSPATDQANGKRIDQVYHLYVDFDVEFPDAFFAPPKVGRID